MEDVTLVIKLQKRIKDLESAKSKLANELDEKEEEEEENKDITASIPNFAYNNLKVFFRTPVLRGFC